MLVKCKAPRSGVERGAVGRSFGRCWVSRLRRASRWTIRRRREGLQEAARRTCAKPCGHAHHSRLSCTPANSCRLSCDVEAGRPGSSQSDTRLPRYDARPGLIPAPSLDRIEGPLSDVSPCGSPCRVRLGTPSARFLQRRSHRLVTRWPVGFEPTAKAVSVPALPPTSCDGFTLNPKAQAQPPCHLFRPEAVGLCGQLVPTIASALMASSALTAQLVPAVAGISVGPFTPLAHPSSGSSVPRQLASRGPCVLVG